MTSAVPAASARLSGPGELVAALPLLCGFPPQDSLVVVCLGAGGRLGLTLRLDLPAEEDVDRAAVELAARVRHSGARSAYLVVLTQENGWAHRALVEALVAEVDVLDALLVRDGRWWSYRCADAGCCPPSGTPVPTSSRGVQQLQVQAVLRGRAVLPSRADLVDALGPPGAPGPRLVALRAAADRLQGERRQVGLAPVRARLLAGMRGALTSLRDGDRPPSWTQGTDAAAELALALHDVVVRDEVLTWALVEEEAVLTLLHRLARLTPAPYDAPVCACLAWVAYSRGDGATAAVVLDRALATEPEHGLALLLQQALDGQVPPRQLRAVTARASQVLRRRRR